MFAPRTRPEKVAEAQRLRSRGKKIMEIAAEMGVSRSSVNDYLNDPHLEKLRARKRSYGGTCSVCGGPTNGNNGRERAAKTCANCIRFTDEEIIAAIRRWADEHDGVPPREVDFDHDPGYPCKDVVNKRFGWNNALIIAGFERMLHLDRRPATWQWILDEVRSGRPTREIAECLGVSPRAVYEHFRRRGMSVAAERGKSLA